MSKNDDFWSFWGCKGDEMARNPLCNWVKDVFLVVSTHFQQNVKVLQISQNFGEMDLAHQVKFVFTWAKF